MYTGKGKLGLKGVDYEARLNKYRAKFGGSGQNNVTARFSTLRQAANFYYKAHNLQESLCESLRAELDKEIQIINLT